MARPRKVQINVPAQVTELMKAAEPEKIDPPAPVIVPVEEPLVAPAEEPLVVVEQRNGVNFVQVKTPFMGCNSFLIESKGIYVLEHGEGVLRSLAVTYVGTGALHVYDGVPDKELLSSNKLSVLDTRFPVVEGRKIITMSPQIVGFWGLDAGFKRGLTVVASGGQAASPVLVSVMWVKHKAAPTAIEFGED